jgi:nucleotide-binding universal stress UspA family protein
MHEKRPRSVVAASDLNEGSDHALVAGHTVSLATGAPLHVFHCVPQPVFPFWEGLVPEETRQRWVDSARLDLEWQLRRVLDAGPGDARIEVGVGDPTTELNAHAAAAGTNLMVLGPHRSRGPLDDLLGGTADRLLRTSAVPCMIANRPLQVPLRRVLLPTDFSPTARRALEVGMEWVEALLGASPARPACDVHLVYVAAFASPSWRPLAIEPRLAAEAEHARQHLRQGEAVRVVPRIVSAPMPEDGIRRAAEQMDAELVVLGTHGYSTLGRALVGSVASTVARTLDRALLVVPPAS